jgi:hypothetical protein
MHTVVPLKQSIALTHVAIVPTNPLIQLQTLPTQLFLLDNKAATSNCHNPVLPLANHHTQACAQLETLQAKRHHHSSLCKQCTKNTRPNKA